MQPPGSAAVSPAFVPLCSNSRGGAGRDEEREKWGLGLNLRAAYGTGNFEANFVNLGLEICGAVILVR